MKLDLAIVGNILQIELSPLASLGYRVGELTWRDVGRPWPHPLLMTLAEAIDPDSVGVAVDGLGAEGRLVLFAAGWGDLEFFDPGRQENVVVDECPEFADEAAVTAAVRRFAQFFRDSASQRRV